MPDFTVVTPKPLSEVLSEGLGFLSETFPTNSIGNGTVATDGTVYLTAIPLRAGMTVTNVHVRVTTVASVASLSKVGLYDAAGNRLALSADLGTSWQSTGCKTHAMGTPYVVTTTGVYYCALVSKGSTPASFARGAGATTQNGPVSGNLYAAFSMTGQTDLPSSVTFASVTNSYWFAVS